MSFIKKTFGIVILVALVLVLQGCGGSPSQHYDAETTILTLYREPQFGFAMKIR